MFDGIKIQNLDVQDKEALRRKLGVSLSVCPNTGEVLTERKETELNGLHFEFYGKYASLKGSIHKYHNKGQHNYDDFYIKDVVNVLKNLHIELDINPRTNRVNNLEFGVNISVPFNVDKFLMNLLIHNGKYFTVRHERNMTFCEYVHSNHIVKFYNKAKQYRHTHQIQGEIMRFEIKVIRMEYLHSKGVKIEYLEDLLKTSFYSKLGQLLLNTYREILIFDSSVNMDALTAKQKKFYIAAENVKYWIELIEAYTSYKGNPKEYRNKRAYYQRKIKEFREIQYRHTKDNKIKLVDDLINQKWKELTTMTPHVNTLINEFLQSEKCSNLTDTHTPDTTSKCSNLTPCIYGQFATNTPEAKCSITGVVLTRNNGKYLSTSELMYYHNNDKELFESLKQKYYKSKTQKDDDIQSVCYYIAHNIRNSETNRRNNLRKRIMRIASVPALFDLQDTLVLTPEQEESIKYWDGTQYGLNEYVK